MEDSFYLHPSVAWRTLSKEKVQIFLPDGNHVTIEGDSREVEKMLNTFRAGFKSGIKDNFAPDIFSEIVKILDSVAALRFTNVSNLASTLENYSEFYAFARERMLAKPIQPIDHFDVIENTGSKIFELASKVVIDQNKNSNQISRQSLSIACADWEDYKFFRTINAEFVELGMPVLFIRWVGDELILGPFVYTQDAPCYECFIARRKASVHYVEEFVASIKSEPNVKLLCDETYEAFFSFVVGRYLTFIRKGAFHLAPIGGIQRWDPIRGIGSDSLLHKIPKCDTCGLVKRFDPLKSVRDLL